MTNLTHNFLTQTEQEKITFTVQEAERATSGEIVPMIVSRSHHYPVAAIKGSILISLPLALLLPNLASQIFWFEPYTVWSFLLCFTPMFFLFRFIIEKTPALHRQFISKEEAKIEVNEEAVKAFYFEKLYKTKAENGILLFISLLEKRVTVLADAGINTLIQQKEWDNIVDSVIEGIQEKKSCDSICSAISSIGALLEVHFPIEKDDKNELHNLLLK